MAGDLRVFGCSEKGLCVWAGVSRFGSSVSGLELGFLGFLGFRVFGWLVFLG